MIPCQYGTKLHGFILATLLFCCAPAGIFAQGWPWAKQSLATGLAHATANATDISGNVVVCGYFNDGAMALGGVSLSTHGANDIYLAQYDASGNVIWAVTAGGTGNDAALSVTTDYTGSVYVAGYTESDTAWFGSQYIVNHGQRSAFIARYDHSGNISWVKGATGTTRNEANALTTDASGNVYAAGRFRDPAIAFDTFTLANTSTDTSDNLFLVKINTGGTVYWIRQGKGNNVEAAGLAISPAGNLVLSGYFGSTAIFGTTTLTGAGGSDLFVTSYTNGGLLLWAKSAGGPGDDFSTSVAVDDSGRIWVGGGFASSTLTIGGTMLSNNGGLDMFLAKLDVNGNFYRAVSAGSTDSELITALVTSDGNAVYAAGNFTGDSLTISPFHLSSSGAGNIFLAKFDSTGSALLAQHSGGSGTDAASGLSRGAYQSAYLSGTLTSPLVYFSFTGLTNTGVSQSFLAKFNDTAIVPGPIFGPLSLCVGTVATMGDLVSEGVWSLSNSTIATIDPSFGFVSGLSAGTDTISYTLHGYTTTTTIAIDTLPGVGVISGPSLLCMYSTATFTDTVGSGRWYSTGTYTSVTGSGIVTPLNPGLDTIRYIDSNVCGTTTATKAVTVFSAPVLSPIAGPGSVCTGATITVTETATGGTWSISNSHATISPAGVVAGVSAGTDSIYYSKTNGICTTIVSVAITVVAPPNAGTITGVSSLCVGASTTFTDSVLGGSFGSLTPAKLHVDTNGVATGISAGPAIVGYTVYNTCGAVSAIKTITVLPLSDPGTITGPAVVCVGSVITLADTAAGGIWNVSNSNLSDSAGAFTGVSAGTDTVSYTTTNSCGSQTTTKVITVNPLPFVTPISGATGLCLGDSTLLTDTTSGGIWSASNSLAHVTGGMVVSSGTSTGTDTIRYTITNSCGSVAAIQVIHIDVIPSAGIISGIDSFCQGASAIYSVSATNGIWSVTDAFSCYLEDSLVIGLSGGTDTLVYTVTNGCATVTATKSITVIPVPVGGMVFGPDTLCVAGSMELYPSNPGGFWSLSNGNATHAGAVMYGVSPGFDTATYTVSNSCGSDFATKAFYVKPQPIVDTISGPASMCVFASVTLTNSSYPGYWYAANTNASVSGGIVNSLNAGTDSIFYAHTDICGTATTFRVITIDPLPDPGSLSGPDTLCVGDSVQLTSTVGGGSWSSQLPFVATVTGGLVTGIVAGSDSILYQVTNACGSSYTAKNVVVVAPVHPLIAGGTFACVGGPNDTLLAYPPTGSWYATNSNALLTPSSVGLVISGVTPGADTIIYLMSGHCGVFRDTAILTVGQVVYPTITGGTSVCVGKKDTLNGFPTGGTWSNGNNVTSIFGTTAGLVVTGDTAGTGLVFYAIESICGTGKDSVQIIVYSKAYCDSVNGVAELVPNTLDGSLFPNPTTGRLYLRTNILSDLGSVYALDMLGKRIDISLVSASTGLITLDIPDCAPGVYMLVYDFGGVTYRHRFMLSGR